MAKDITIDQEIKEVERELGMRRRVYPDWSKGPSPKLKPADAEHRIACLERTLERLKLIRATVIGKQANLF